jgi:hypothetical protein
MANKSRVKRVNVARRSMGKVSVTALALALALPGGAAAADPPAYPPSWASIKGTPIQHGCPNLAGTFSNRAVAAYPEDAGAAPSLRDLFTAVGNKSGHELHGSWGAIGESVAVSIAQDGDNATVAFAHAGGEPTKLTLQRWTMGKAYSPQRGDFFVCLSSKGEPRLILNSTVDDGKAVAPNTVGTQLILLKASDGSLIVQLRSNSYEVIDLGIIGGPMVHHSSVWYRYPPATAGTSATTP